MSSKDKNINIDFWHESLSMKFNKFPKAKYELIIGVYCVYSFVTTRRDEKSCVELLLERLLTNHSRQDNRTYLIYKTQKGERELISKGINYSIYERDTMST